MSDLTNYTEGQFRDWMSQGTSVAAAPDPIYVALHTSDPGESPDGSTEVSATDYDRYSSSAGTDWDTPNENDFQNSNEFSFGVATNNWGTISHVSLWDGTSGTDNCLAAYGLNTSKEIDVDDEAKFQSGDLSFSLD
jgi:hypothetical protein